MNHYDYISLTAFFGAVIMATWGTIQEYRKHKRNGQSYTPRNLETFDKRIEND